MAVTMISGFKGTLDLSTYRLAIDLADRIALLDINENPATYVAKKVKTQKAKQPKVSFLTDVMRPYVDQVNFSTGYASNLTAVTVDNYAYFTAGDLWQVFDSYELMFVNSVSSDGIVNFIRNYASVASGVTGYRTALVDDDYLTRVGNVNEEGAGAPTANMTTEVQVDNYNQILRTPFELSNTELASLFEAEADLPYTTRKKGLEHSQDMERLFFWGLPSVAQTGTLGKPARMTGGAWYFIKEGAPSGNVVTDTDITEDEFLEWLRNCFRYGSSRKWLFCCPLMASAIEKWGLVKLQTAPGGTLYGFAPTRWVSVHGEVMIVIHKMLEGVAPGTAGGWAFILDMNEISYRPLRDTKLLTNRQANDEDRYEAEYLTEFTFLYGNPEKHGAMHGITSFSA